MVFFEEFFEKFLFEKKSADDNEKLPRMQRVVCYTYSAA